MTSNKQQVLINNVIAAAEVSRIAGFTDEQVWEQVKSVVMEMEGMSEIAAIPIIQEAKRQMAAGPGKTTVAERLERKMVYSAEYEKTLLAYPQDKDHVTLSIFIGMLEVDEDTAYDETSAALEAITKDGLEQVESELDYHCDTADDYSHDLLPWAHKNLHWCNRVTDEGITGRTFVEIIRVAQVEAKQYIWKKVVELVRRLEEEEEGGD